MAGTSGQEEFLAVIRKSQEAMIAVVRNLAETARRASNLIFPSRRPSVCPSRTSCPGQRAPYPAPTASPSSCSPASGSSPRTC